MCVWGGGGGGDGLIIEVPLHINVYKSSQGVGCMVCLRVQSEH